MSYQSKYTGKEIDDKLDKITELPIASNTTLGGIKVGDGLEITNEGVLSAIGEGSIVGGSYTESELLNSQVSYTLTANSSVSIN